MIRWLTGRNRVRHFAADAARHAALDRHPLFGTQAIPVERIVGSVGRAHELRRDFRSFHTLDGDLRYHQVRTLMKRGAIFAPVELYRLEDRYYVVDGHHRVAAARALGQLYVDALVTEFWPVCEALGLRPLGPGAMAQR